MNWKERAGWKGRVPDEQRLHQQLLADCEPAVRPIFNSSQPVLVHFRLGLYQIVDLVGRFNNNNDNNNNNYYYYYN